MSMQLSTGQATKKDSLALSLSLTPNQIQMLDRSMNNFRNSKDLRIDLGASINSQNIAEQLDLSQETNNLGLLNHPKYAQYFKRRVCVRYVPDPNTKLCMGCQQGIHEGAHKYIGNEWNYRTCTICQPTDAFGKLAFPGSHSKTASYIRVQNETKTKDMIQYLYSPEGWNLQRPQLILSVTGGAQKFTIPHRMKKAFKRGLIKAAASTGAWIITGGTNTGVMRLVGEAVADEFHTCNLTVLGIATWGKIAFREQMVKKSPRHIQATMNFEDLNKEAQQIRYNGTIYKKIIFNDKKKRMKKMLLKNLELENKLMYQTPLFYAQTESGNQSRSGAKPGANTDVLLDPNHTHFILVDDGSENQFGKEIEFRAHLEAELRKGRSLKYYESKRSQRLKKQQQQLSARSISLNRLETSQHSNSQQPTPQPPQQSDDDDDDDDEDGVKNESVPMILIVVQGGPNTLITVEQSLKQTVPVLILADSKGCADIIASACSIVKPDDSQLEKLIIESKMFEYFAKDPVAYQKKTNEAVERLKYIISRLSDNLINVFRLDSEEGGQDIELTILRAFLNSRKNKYYENLKLALQWNRDDIAKTDIFTGEEEFKSHQLANLMEMALLQNKPRFVELLLENGLNLKSFLTIRRLYFLYNSYKIQSDAKKAPLFQLYKKKYSSDHSASMITFRGLLRFLKEYLFEDFDPVFLPDDQDYGQVERFLHCANKKESSDVEMKDSTSEFNFGKNEVAFPEQNLFLWALFLNRIEIAIIFWQIGEHQICSALFASNLLKSMSYRLTDLEKELQKYANDFEQMAIGVLNIFDATTDDLINGVILLRKIPFFNLDCLQMAVEADCKKFVSLSSVQNLLTDIWYGKIASTSGLKASFKFAASILSLGFLAPFLVFSKREKLTHLSDRENTLKKLATYNKKKNISNLLRSYLTNNEINADTREAHLLPRLCKSADDSSSSSSSSDSSDQDSSDDLEPQSRQTDSGACSGEVSEASPDESGSPSVHSLGAAESGAAGGGDADLAANRRRRRRRKRNKRSGVVKKRQSKWTTYWSRYLHFVHSPRVHFVYDALFYLVFLFLFSYWILCEFEYDELVEAWVSETSESGARLARSSLSSSGVSTDDFETSNRTNMTSSTSTSISNFRSNLTTSSSWSNFSTSTATRSMSSSTQGFDNMVFVTQRVVKYPSWIEWLLIYWMISFAAEEARQYFFGDAETKVLKNKLLHYFENNWNYLDISGCLVFSIGICLRFLAMSTGEALFVAARIVLCMDLCIWYVRILHVSVVFKSLGPKLVMIQKMIRDLMFFISIIAIFICAFGVTTQATLYPGRNKLDFELFKAILDKAYWPIYGEMRILDEMDRCEGTSGDSMNDSSSLPCPETSGIAFSFIALMVYMVIANVLLINLLIAMFSSTFQDVQENTDQIWKFQRYRLVFEYYDSPILPPPLNFIAYFVALVHYLKQRSKLAAHRDTNTGVKTSASVTSSLAFEPPDDDKPENTAKDDVDLLLDRERKFAEEYVRMEKFRLKETTDSRLKITLEKLETLEQKLNEVIETRFKESNQLSVAINWIMSELDSDRRRAPYIQNLNLSRKGK